MTQVKYFPMIKIYSLNTKVVVTWNPVGWFALKLKTYKKHLIFWSFQNIFRVYRKKPTSKHSSWRRLTSLSSEDVLNKTNMLASALLLQKTSSKRLQDVLQKCLQEVLKTSSRRVEDVFKTCKDIFKTFSRCIINLDCSC